MFQASWSLHANFAPSKPIANIIKMKDDTLLIFYHQIAIPSKYTISTDTFIQNLFLDHHYWNFYHEKLITFDVKNNNIFMVTDHGEISLSVINLPSQSSERLTNCGDYHAKYLIHAEELLYYINSSKNYSVFQQTNTTLTKYIYKKIKNNHTYKNIHIYIVLKKLKKMNLVELMDQ